MEQDDCSSCSSFPPLESSNENEIVTNGEEFVQSIPEYDQNMFLVESLCESIRMATNVSGLVRTMGEYLSKIPSIPRLNIYIYSGILVAVVYLLINMINLICVNLSDLRSVCGKSSSKDRTQHYCVDSDDSSGFGQP